MSITATLGDIRGSRRCWETTAYYFPIPVSRLYLIVFAMRCLLGKYILQFGDGKVALRTSWTYLSHPKKDLFNVDLIATKRTGSRYYRRLLSD